MLKGNLSFLYVIHYIFIFWGSFGDRARNVYFHFDCYYVKGLVQGAQCYGCETLVGYSAPLFHRRNSGGVL